MPSIAINIKDASFTVGRNPPEYDRILSFDLGGRLIGTYVRSADDEANYRRGFDNRIIKLVKDVTLRNRWIEQLSDSQRDALLAASFKLVDAALHDVTLDETECELLRRAARNGPAELAVQRERFISIYGAVPILPPDQYRALVVQATRGCPFNTCKFCSFYRGCDFRIPSATEFATHMEAVREFFGESLRLRHSVFLGDANAILIPTKILLQRIAQVRAGFDVAPPDLPPEKEAAWKREHPYGLIGLYGFLDGLTGTRKSQADYAALAAAGLRRVYIGAESGCDEVLAGLGKPCRRADVIETVALCKQAGIAVAVILLAGLGANDASLAARHVARSCELIHQLPLDPEDIVYLSPYVDTGSRPAALPAFAENQLAAMQAGLARPSGGPRVVLYDIRGFIY